MDGGSTIHRHQEIPDAFLADLREARQASHFTALPDAWRVASIPAALAETWLRQGFDIYRESAAAICARLRAEDLHAFLATDRRI